MNIHILRENLKKTVAAKESLLADYRLAAAMPKCNPLVSTAMETSIRFLEGNMDELYKMLADVEVCCAQANEADWAANPEGMGR